MFIFELLKIYPTNSGENTLYLPEMDETYHSRDGVLSEASHVFISHGFDKVKATETIRVLEIGFGTGLNALVTAVEAEKTNKKVVYTSIEAYPVPLDLALELNYGALVNRVTLFEKIQHAKWEQEIPISGNFYLQKLEQKIQDAFFLENSFDVVYFDAFAPKKQPEMWDISIFAKLYKCLKNGGILTTYSAAGQLKRDLKAVGFTIHHPPGANGKREMTVAVKL